MKNYSLFTFITLAILFSSCGASNSNTENTDETKEVSNKEPNETKETTQEPVEFKVFLADFAKKVSNKEDIMSYIDFPIYYDTYSTSGLPFTKENAGSFTLYVDESSIVFASDGKTLNEHGWKLTGDLKKHILDRYKDLNNIYTVEREGAPDGYIMIFKLVDNDYKIVAYETTMIAG